MSELSNLCSVDELLKRIDDDKLCVVDSSWYMPGLARNTQKEFQQKHIPKAVFFHIDLICDLESELPHMLPSADAFAIAVGALGISNQTELVIYDSSGLFSAARVWWMFKVFGHDKVRVLDGGLPAWIKQGGKVNLKPEQPRQKLYRAKLNKGAVAVKQTLLDNCGSGRYLVLDARSTQRFLGLAPEPRPGLSSGNMPQSVSLPFDALIENGRLRPRQQLVEIFTDRGVNQNTQAISTCGSGVTAAIITLALFESGFGINRLYDGSWTEWALAHDSIILDSDQ